MKMSAVLIALALLAGCGGNNGDSTDKDAKAPGTPAATATATQDAPTGATMSAAAWSKQVKAICAKSAAKASQEGKELRRKSAADGDSKQELASKVLTSTSNALDPWLDQIEALPKPEGHEQDANQFIASMRNVGDLLGKAATAIKQNDQTSGKRIVRQLKAKGDSVRSQALDIDECNPPAA